MTEIRDFSETEVNTVRRAAVQGTGWDSTGVFQDVLDEPLGGEPLILE